MSDPKRQLDIQSLQRCFRVLHVDKHPQEIIVPSCVQFKIKGFTEVNFENLSAQVNGVLCVNFFIFTHDKHLENMLLERLYWNPEEQLTLEKNRKKKITRESNFLPVTFNKDVTVKLPTTRSKEFQIQAFKSRIAYNKGDKSFEGWRVFHLIRKEFTVEIIKSEAKQEFWAPFNFINLDMTVCLDHMEIDAFQYKWKENIDRQKQYMDYLNQGIKQEYKVDQKEGMYIKRISFNNLRIEEPMANPNLPINEKMRMLAPMITNSSTSNFGKYDVAETFMEAYSYDQREVINLQQREGIDLVFKDKQPTQLNFRPFKYAIFKIPLYRFPVVDMMTIFIPLWLLGFISIYIFYQTTEIMNRIINVAGLMIAYAAVQPIVRENLPDATRLTLVDLLIYMELLTNILFLARSISIRGYFDDDANTTDPLLTNTNYNRWEDGLFIASVALTFVNIIIVVILIVNYLYKKKSYKGPPLKKRPFSIGKEENWTLNLLMDRAYARYKEPIFEFDDIFGDKKAKQQNSPIRIKK